MMNDFDQAFAAFLDRANQLLDEGINVGSPYRKQISPEEGRRYIRLVVSENGNHRSAWCFIDKTNGDVLKTASWKSPEKNFARGNIFDDQNGLGRFDWTGIR